MKVPDISMNEFKEELDHSTLTVWKYEKRITQNGDKIEYYSKTSGDGGDSEIHFKGKITAWNNKMRVVKIIDDQGEVHWFDMNEKDFGTDRQLKILYFTLPESENFTDEHFNILVDFHNIALQTILGNKIKLEINQKSEYYETYKKDGYYAILKSTTLSYDLLLQTPEDVIFKLQTGISTGKYTNEKFKRGYYRIQWLAKDVREKIAENISKFIKNKTHLKVDDETFNID